jgi:hypothetical protein
LADSWQSAARAPAAAWRPFRDRFLRHKLARRNATDRNRAFAISLATRVVASAECFVSMLLIAWVGALAGAICALGWKAVESVDEASIMAASPLADRVAADLLPVLLPWAALLLVAPAAYRGAVPAAAALAAIVGYLHLVPPAFLSPYWVSRAATALSAATAAAFRAAHHSKNPVGIEIAWGAIMLALLLQFAALRRFRRLQDLGNGGAGRSGNGPLSRRLTRKLAALPLIALALLLSIWAGTVVRLTASHSVAPGSIVAYGEQGGAEQANYLLIVIIIAIVLSQLGNARIIAPVALLTLIFILAPSAQEHVSRLRIPLWREALVNLGGQWGTEALWIALFASAPTALLAIYLSGRLLAPREINLN